MKKSAIVVVVLLASIVFSGSQARAQTVPKASPEIVAENLRVPWEMAFLPDRSILVTERAGTLRKLGNDGFSIPVPDVFQMGEGGLLGMALHPNFSSNRWIYFYHTTNLNGGIKNVVERYVLSGDQLTDRKMIIDNIPAAQYHDGGRLAFGPDGYLYVTTGSASNDNFAQDKSNLAGKILRVRDDGSIPEDNPFGNEIYSSGHRNSQGLAWDNEGRLWATDHGRSGVLSGLDELNLIYKGGNYGWPVIQGNETSPGILSPIINSGAAMTWAPSGAVYCNGSIFFAGLRGQAIYEYKISDNSLFDHYKNQFGRIRDIVYGPDGNFYLLTNNTDGRGQPRAGDDKIIKISPEQLLAN